MKTDVVSVHDSKVVKRLIELGVIPPQCKSWKLEATADHVVTMISEVFVTSAQMEYIGKVLEQFPDEAQQIAQTVFTAMKSGESMHFVGEEWAKRFPSPKVNNT